MARNRWLFVVPVCLWAVGGLGWAASKPSAQEILERCARRYAHARTLTADLEIAVGGTMGSAEFGFKSKAQLARQRPNLLRYRLPALPDGELNQILLVSDGQTLCTEVMSLVAMRTPAPTSQAAFAKSVQEVTMPFAGPVILPSSPVYDDASMMDGVRPDVACREPKVVGQEVVDGHPCWVVEATIGERRRERFWIDRETYVLRQIWTDWNPIPGLEGPRQDVQKPGPEPMTPFEKRAARIRETGSPMAPVLTVTVTYRNLQLGRPLRQETFRYVPDEAVRVVESQEELSRVLLEAIAGPMFSQPPSPAPSDQALGQKAPDFTLPLVSGGELSLSSLRGKVVFLDFFAEWCPPCQQEIPELIDIHNTMGDRVTIIGILISSNLDEAGMENYIREKGIPYPVVNGGSEPDEISQAYGVEALPTNVVIGADGRIYARLEGYGGREPLDQAIQQAISGELPAPEAIQMPPGGG